MKRRLFALACLALLACGDPQEQELKSAASWSATALAVARYWLQGDLPDAYAKRALEKASEELAKGALPDASEPVNELIEAIGKRDQQAVRRLIAELERR
jgi:uncharacterized protein YciW